MQTLLAASAACPGKSWLGHAALAASNVCILESLALGGVSPGRYRLVCLPLNLEGADGAPARAILEPLL